MVRATGCGSSLRSDHRSDYDSFRFPATPTGAAQLPPGEVPVKELARFLLQNAQIDFSGEITMEQVRQFLRDDDSREARALLARLIEDKGVDDMLVTVADCLKEYITEGINEETVRAQLAVYGES
jgi:hypothetical protein